MKKVTKQTVIGDILDAAPDTAVFLPGDRYALPGLPHVPR